MHIERGFDELVHYLLDGEMGHSIWILFELVEERVWYVFEYEYEFIVMAEGIE